MPWESLCRFLTLGGGERDKYHMNMSKRDQFITLHTVSGKVLGVLRRFLHIVLPDYFVNHLGNYGKLLGDNVSKVGFPQSNIKDS